MFEKIINFFFSKNENKKQSGYITIIEKNRQENSPQFISSSELNYRRDVLLKELKAQSLTDELSIYFCNNKGLKSSDRQLY